MSDEFYNYEEEFEGMSPQERAEFLFAKMMSDGRIDELVFRATFVKRVVAQIHEMLGGDGLLELLVALDHEGNWETEISHLNLGFSEQRPEDDYRKEIQRVKVERYNFKELEKYHAVAVLEANDSQIVANLLAKGKTNSELYGKG